MRAKGKHYVDYTCQNDEPRNDYVDRQGGEKWRTNRHHAENDQHNPPKDCQRRSLTYDVGRTFLCHRNLLKRQTNPISTRRFGTYSRRLWSSFFMADSFIHFDKNTSSSGAV